MGEPTGLRQVSNAARLHKDIWHGDGIAAWLRCLADEVTKAGAAAAARDKPTLIAALAMTGGICANWIDEVQGQGEERDA